MSTTTPTVQSALTILKLITQQKNKTSKNVLFEVVKENQAHITYNRPKVMNAFSFDMYFLLADYIVKANQMDNIKYIVIKGSGGNFSTGNDLNVFGSKEMQALTPKLRGQTMSQGLKQLVEIMVKSRKPIFALVQGKAIGFGFTQLALCDRVFASDNSQYLAPLVRLAQGPQMASSYTFPKIFGPVLAEQIIMKTKPMFTQQLQKYNYLTRFQNITDAQQGLQSHIADLQKLDYVSYLEARRLMRFADQQNLLKANVLECQNLSQRWSNPQLPKLMAKYLSKEKPKL